MMTRLLLLLSPLLALIMPIAAAFAPPVENCSMSSRKIQHSHIISSLHATSSQTVSRRDLLKLMTLPITITALPTSPTVANAENDLFKPNPLANPVLEKIRIWEQEEADNIIYKGELASGSSGSIAFDQYVTLLQPILLVERNILQLNELLPNTNNEDLISSLQQMKEILQQPNLDTKAFKKSFNAFADNIYYVDTDRANAYLGGGATPGSTQSIAYLLRNDVLTNVEDMRAEVSYLIRELEKGGKIGQDGLVLDDLSEMIKMAKEGMRKYLDVVPPKELEAARAKFRS